MYLFNNISLLQWMPLNVIHDNGYWGQITRYYQLSTEYE